jgi:hypothetical protein
MAERRDDPRGFVVEVDDHAKPPAWSSRVAVVPLAARPRIGLSIVRVRDRFHDGALESNHFEMFIPDVYPLFVP